MAGTLGMEMGGEIGSEMGMEMGGVHITAMVVTTPNHTGMRRRRHSVNTRGTEMVHTILCHISTHKPLGRIRASAIREPDQRPAITISSHTTMHLGKSHGLGGRSGIIRSV